MKFLLEFDITEKDESTEVIRILDIINNKVAKFGAKCLGEGVVLGRGGNVIGRISVKP